MRALVLSAGYGTRLGELTQSAPKPMLQAGGRPILELILRHLVGQGISEIAVNLHFRPDVIRSHFGDGAAVGARIHWSYEEELQGTAGGVREVADFLSPTPEFVVHYGDVVTTQDLAAMRSFHRARGALATMLVHERQGSNSIAVAAPDGRVERFLERPTEAERAGIDSLFAFSGVCICSRDVLDLIPRVGPCDLPRDVFPKLVAVGGLYAFRLDGFRCAVDSEERLELLRDACVAGVLDAGPRPGSAR